MIAQLTVIGVSGLPEIKAGDDLAAHIADAALAGPGIADGDILVVTSKIVSKAEDRVVRADREAAIDAETVRVVARRGHEKTPTQTPQEFVRKIEDARLREPVSRFTDVYESARFGNSTEDAQRLPELYEEVELAAKNR